MELNRRGFIRMFGMGAAVAVAKPTYFFAPPSGWVGTESGIVVPAANQFLNTEWVTAQCLRILMKNLSFAEDLNRKWGETFPLGGQAVDMKMPMRFAL